MIGSLIVLNEGVWDEMDNKEAAHVVNTSSCVTEDGKLQIDLECFQVVGEDFV
jgi:hypothetical protein